MNESLNYLNIFRFGKFYSYNICYADPSWDNDNIFIAASLFASLKHRGYDDSEAYSLSSKYIYMKTMPGLNYTSLGNNIIPHSTKKNTIV